MKRWNEAEYRVLFRDHPPVHAQAPDHEECAAVARQVDRTPGAIASQWHDARSTVLGNRSAASRSLVAYLINVGWLD